MRTMYKIETITREQMEAARYLERNRRKRNTGRKRLFFVVVALAAYAVVVGVLS